MWGGRCGSALGVLFAVVVLCIVLSPSFARKRRSRNEQRESVNEHQEEYDRDLDPLSRTSPLDRARDRARKRRTTIIAHTPSPTPSPSPSPSVPLESPPSDSRTARRTSLSPSTAHLANRTGNTAHGAANEAAWDKKRMLDARYCQREMKPLHVYCISLCNFIDPSASFPVPNLR